MLAQGKKLRIPIALGLLVGLLAVSCSDDDPVVPPPPPPQPAPTLTSVSPTEGSSLGGTALTLSGTNFVAVATVAVGGVQATSVILVNDNTITCVSPAGIPGPGAISVTTPGGTATLTGKFVYNPTAIIGPAGGSIKSADGRLTLTIPPGALTGNSQITIKNADPAGLGTEFPSQSAVEILSERPLDKDKRAGLAVSLVAPVNPAPPAPGVQQISISFPLGFIATSVGTLAAVVDSFEFFFDPATGALQAFGSLDLSGGPTQPPAEGVSAIVAVGLWPGLTVEIDGIPVLPLGAVQDTFNLTTTITATADNILAGDEVTQWRTFPPPHLFYSGQGVESFSGTLQRGANTVTHVSSSYFCSQVCLGICEPLFVELFFLDCTRPSTTGGCTEMVYVIPLFVQCASVVPPR